MGFFENIYGDKPERTRSEKMYDYAFDVMNDVDLQYAAMTPDWQRMVRSGEPCDTVPGGKGEFGHDLGNPIPVNGPIGEFSYLSRLRMKSTGSRVYFHRVANHDGIDEFELTNVSRAVCRPLVFRSPSSRSFGIISGYVLSGTGRATASGHYDDMPRFPTGTI